MKGHKGFTLIELLIVVAIIAILAAIAIPNFLAAQTRSKVARVKADMRSIATALEAYDIDFGQYPYYTNPINYFMFLHITPDVVNPMSPDSELTTPVAYITSIPLDQFGYSVGGTFNYPFRYSPFNQANNGDNYNRINSNYHGVWVLGSDGPNPGRTFNPMFSAIGSAGSNIDIPRIPLLYDPTNGTISNGNIVRSQGGSVQNF